MAKLLFQKSGVAITFVETAAVPYRCSPPENVERQGTWYEIGEKLKCYLAFIVQKKFSRVSSMSSWLPESHINVLYTYLVEGRSSSQGIFSTEMVRKDFAIILGKQLQQSPVFSKVLGMRPATLLKKESRTSVLQWTVYKFSEHLLCRTPVDA